MTKRNLITNGKKYCLLILLLFIVSGCSTLGKKEQILLLQRNRIQSLEKQIEKQNQIIGDLKSQKWIRKPVVPDERIAFVNLKRLMKEKNWIEALNESSKLKKNYDKSFQLHVYRFEIFKNMGLARQAQQEQDILKQLHASPSNKELRVR